MKRLAQNIERPSGSRRKVRRTNLAKYCLFLTFLCSSLSLAKLVAQEAKYLSSPILPDVSRRADFEVVVDPTAADSGSFVFSNVSDAIQAVRKQRERFPDDSIAVVFRTNRIDEPIVIENLAGTPENPIVFKAAVEGDGFDGGFASNGIGDSSAGASTVDRPIWFRWNQSPFFQLGQTRTETLKKRIRPEFADKIWVASLKNFGVDNLGDPTELGKRPEFFWIRKEPGRGESAVPQTLARFPNDGFVNAGNVLGETKIDSWDGPGTKEGVFEYLGDEPSRWIDEPDARLFGYWFWDWAESYAKVESIDQETKTIRITPPYHNYGYKNGFRYFATNLLSELDSPGEFYIDRENGLIFWFPEIDDPNALGTATILSNFDSPFMLEIRGCSDLVFVDLSFRFGRQNAIKIESSERCLIRDCFIYGFGKDAVHIDGGSENGVWGTRIECLGAGGVSINGGDRKTLTPCNHFIENNVIESFSRLQRTYAPAILARGCGIRIAHNEISGSSSSAMRLEGNDMLVEFNKISNVVEESDDQGGIDSWYNPSFRGIVIRYNYWRDIVGGTRCGAAGIRLDDMISGFEIYGNVFERCGAVQFGAVQIHGGKDNRVENNLFFDCFAAVSFSRWGDRYLKALEGSPESLDKSSVLKKIYQEVDIRSPLWLEKYPELARIKENPDVNFVENNLIVNCDRLFLRDGDVQKTSNNVELTIEDATVLSIVNGDLFEKNGLKPIPFDRFGVRAIDERTENAAPRDSDSDSLDSESFNSESLPAAEKLRYWMFVGTYSWEPNDATKAKGLEKSEGIYAILFDPTTGTFEGEPKLVAAANSPSYLATGRTSAGELILYAVEEGSVRDDSANVCAFRIDETNGSATFLNRRPTGGDWPCHLSVLTRSENRSILGVANYGSGDFVFFRLNDDGSVGEEVERVRKEGSGPNRKRQDGPKAHSVLDRTIATNSTDSSTRSILLNDLGCDKVYLGFLDETTSRWTDANPPFIELPPGSGPRHLAQIGSTPFFFVNNELNSTIAAFALDEATVQCKGVWATLSDKLADKTTDDPSLVDGERFVLANSTAEIATLDRSRIARNRRYFPFISRLFRQNSIDVEPWTDRGFVYVSNRGDDSIAVFRYNLFYPNAKIDDGSLDVRFDCERIQIQSTFGATPRFFAADPTGQYLIVCNQDSSSIVLFKIDSKTGELIKSSVQPPLDVPYPVALAFVQKVETFDSGERRRR